MYRLLVVCSLAVAAAGTPAFFDRDPGTAAILAETRMMRADGSSDVAYAQEDGVTFKEVTNKDGERRGSYEYVGDDGRTYRVEYSAGVGGFRVLKSGHVDTTPVQPTGAPEPIEKPKPAAKKAAANTNTFHIHYDLGRAAAAAAPTTTTTYRATTTTTTYRPTTTTTTYRPVRKNFHTGRVTLDRNEKGYVYTYHHNG